MTPEQEVARLRAEVRELRRTFAVKVNAHLTCPSCHQSGIRANELWSQEPTLRIKCSKCGEWNTLDKWAPHWYDAESTKEG